MSFLNKNKPRDLYHNINAVNKSSIPVPLRYSDTRGSVIIDNVDNYSLSILRFSLDTSEVPLMIFPNTRYDNFQSPTYSGTDDTYYYVCIEDGNGLFANASVTYTNYGRTAPYIYNFNHFCDMLNTAIFTACSVVGNTIRVPYFEYNKATASIDLVCPVDYDMSINLHSKIYVNKNLYDLFCKDFNGSIVEVDAQRYYRIYVGGTGSNSITTQKVISNGLVVNPSIVPGYRMATYHSNLGNMVACRAIVFTTSQIPVISEVTSDDLDLVNDTSNSTSKILKDFELNVEEGNAIHTRGIQSFNIASEFQLTQLKSGGEALKYIDINGFWKDSHGRLHELYLPVGSLFSMKILFKLSV